MLAFGKERKRTQKERKFRKGAGLWKLAHLMEIDQGGLRHHSLDDFHSCLKKPPQKTLRLFHSYSQAQ